MFYFIVNKLCQLINAVLAYMGVMIDAGGSSCSVHQCCSLLLKVQEHRIMLLLVLVLHVWEYR